MLAWGRHLFCGSPSHHPCLEVVLSSSAERMSRKRGKDRFELELRKRCDELSKLMLVMFPDRDKTCESGRADRALAYWKGFDGS